MAVVKRRALRAGWEGSNCGRIRRWQLEELPGFHDLQKPLVEWLRSRYLIEKASVQEPYLERRAHGGIGAEEFRRRGAVDRDVDRVLHRAGRLVHLECLLGDLRLVVRDDENNKGLIGGVVFKQHNHRAVCAGLLRDRQVVGIVQGEMIDAASVGCGVRRLGNGGCGGCQWSGGHLRRGCPMKRSPKKGSCRERCNA